MLRGLAIAGEDVEAAVLRIINVPFMWGVELVWCTGAGEDVEAVLARLQAQSAENAALKERQAKASSDLQVTHRLHTSAPNIRQPGYDSLAVCNLLLHIMKGQLPCEICRTTLIPNFPCTIQLSGAQNVPRVLDFCWLCPV